MIATLTLATLWCIFYCTTYHRTFHSNRIHLNYRTFLLKGELWRLFTSCFYHIDGVHLLFDLLILFSLLPMEAALGSVLFLAACFQILITTVGLQMVIYHFLDQTVHPSLTVHYTCSMGFSSVLLGLLTAHAQHAETVEFILFPGLPIYAANAPLLGYLLASCLLTEASVLGHFCAGLAGWLLGTGGLQWLAGYWLSCVAVWVLGGVVTSLKTTTMLGTYMKFVECTHWPPWKPEDTSSSGMDRATDDQIFVTSTATRREAKALQRREADEAKRRNRDRDRNRNGRRREGEGEEKGGGAEEIDLEAGLDSSETKEHAAALPTLHEDAFTFFEDDDDANVDGSFGERKGLLGD